MSPAKIPPKMAPMIPNTVMMMMPAGMEAIATLIIRTIVADPDVDSRNADATGRRLRVDVGRVRCVVRGSSERCNGRKAGDRPLAGTTK